MLEDLRPLVEFAHAGSIAGAADRLFRTPSIRSKEQYLAVMSFIIEAIGNPPIVELSRLTRSRPGTPSPQTRLLESRVQGPQCHGNHRGG
jgi:hypothetical protein